MNRPVLEGLRLNVPAYVKHDRLVAWALIDRIISSTAARIILDPFSGSGTTAITALGLKRNYIGIELSPDYCQTSEDRIERNKKQSELLKFKTMTLFQEIE